MRLFRFPVPLSIRSFLWKKKGYANHADWKRDWQGECGSHFSVLGSNMRPRATRLAKSGYPRMGAYRLRVGLPEGGGEPEAIGSS